jgi:hypothetical protein
MQPVNGMNRGENARRKMLEFSGLSKAGLNGGLLQWKHGAIAPKNNLSA